MKRIITLFAILLLAGGLFAQTTTGNITADETWSGTMTITGDVIVTNGAVLTIAPGAVIKFATTNDNVVFGSSSAIRVVAYDGASFQANGTSDNRITFTTTSPFAAAGAWGKFHPVNGAADCSFSYCDWEYCTWSMTVENISGNTDTTAVNVTVDNCTVTNSKSTGLYASAGNNVTITNSDFLDCGKFFFFDGAGTITMSNVTLANGSAGFILAGKDNGPTVSLDHISMYNIDMMIASSPKWWDGYGIFCTNTANALTLTNSVLVQSTLANLIANSWTVTENHNCMYTGMLGLMNYEDGTPDATDIVGDFASPVDPLFVDPGNGDFSVVCGSPVIGAASDASNMGAYQGTCVPGTGMNTPAVSGLDVTLPNPVCAGMDIPGTMRVFDLQGNSMGVYTGIMGADLTPGVYYYSIEKDGATFNGTFVMAR